ncbi:BppU family phage baseplate upper protein [Enterococcus gilvus]|uniref:BppU family phage baseplate upper protein n=1 Tax=Enterococcus gilvus TaxID=160453 RepID=UPI003EDAA502
MSNKILNLDLSKDPIMPAIIYGRVGDDRLQTVTVNVTKRDEVTDLTGYDITFEGTTYNRQTKVFDSDNISSTPTGLKKGTFDYTFPNMAFAVSGKYEQAYFSIVKDGKRDTTANFEIIVDGNADIDAPEAETIITEYNKLVDELHRLQKQFTDNLKKDQEDYIKDMVASLASINTQISNLESKITLYETNVNKVASDAKKLISEVLASALDTINKALEEFQKGNFYTKLESDERFAKKVDLTKENVQLGNVDNYATANQTDAEQGIAPNKFMTPMGVKQHVDSRIATTEEAGTGERNDVLITPKRLIEILKQYTLFKEHFGNGEELKDNTTDGVLLKIGESLGGSINYDTARPYKINTDGSLTFNKDGRFRFSGSAKLVAGDTNPTDYMYTQIVVGSTINDWINQGSSKAANGTMRLTWTFAGSIILDVNSGNRVYIRSSIRSGKQAFLAQLMELTIEEVRFSG